MKFVKQVRITTYEFFDKVYTATQSFRWVRFDIGFKAMETGKLFNKKCSLP